MTVDRRNTNYLDISLALTMFFKLSLFFLIIVIGTVNAEEQNTTDEEYIYSEYNTEKSTDWCDQMCQSAKQCDCTQKNLNLMFDYWSWNPINCSCIEKSYDSDKAPEFQRSTRVYNRIQRAEVFNVDEVKKTVSFNLKLMYMWEDKRIHTKFPTGVLDIKLAYWFRVNGDEKRQWIWDPAAFTYIENLQKRMPLNDEMFTSETRFLASNPFVPNTTLIQTTSEGRVTTFCNFEFSNFPMDSHRCKFRAGSMGSMDLKEMLLLPDDTFNFQKEYEAVGFDITIDFQGNTSTYQTFGFDIKMKRQIESYIFQYYLPCIAIVVVSSISFFVPLSAMPGRIALAVTQFLTLTNIFISQMVSVVWHNIPFRFPNI